MNKKLVSTAIFSIVLLLLSSLIISCSTPASPTSAPPATSAAAPAAPPPPPVSSAAAPAAPPASSPAAAAKPAETIKLKLADYGAPGDDMVNGVNWHEWWAGKVKERTNGKVQIDVYHAESLCKAADSLNALDAGIADIVHLPIPVFPERFPLTNFLSDSAVCYGNGKLTSNVIKNLLAAGGMKEFEAYSPIYFSRNPVSGASTLYTTKKRVAQLADLKGMKIRARGTPTTALLNAMGATPVTIATADLYMSADRGLIDGLITPPAFFDTAKLYEVLKYQVSQGLSGSIKCTVMVPAKFNALPADVQTVMKNLADESQDFYADGSEANAQLGGQHLVAKGGEIIKLDAAEAAKWQAIMDDVTNKLVSDMQAKGQDMKKVMDVVNSTKANFKP
jgi:TRAP-type transport system periplasmic protein